MTSMPRDEDGSAVARLSPERRRAVLEERTRRLAQRAASRAEVETVRALAFVVGPNLYGLPMEAVARVRPLGRLGLAPSAAPALLGLVAESGRILEAMDLAALVGRPGDIASTEGWLVALAPPLDAALRLEALPFSVDVEPLAGPDEGRARIVDGEHRDKVLVMLSPRELLASAHHSPTHGAVAP